MCIRAYVIVYTHTHTRTHTQTHTYTRGHMFLSAKIAWMQHASTQAYVAGRVHECVCLRVCMSGSTVPHLWRREGALWHDSSSFTCVTWLMHVRECDAYLDEGACLDVWVRECVWVSRMLWGVRPITGHMCVCVWVNLCVYNQVYVYAIYKNI